MNKRIKTKSADQIGPSRAVIDQCSYTHTGGYHISGKTLYPAEWESPNERDALYLLLMCNDVTVIEAQPAAVDYLIHAIKRTYTPDFRIEVAGEKRYIEAKSLRYLLLDDNLTKYTAIAAHLQSQGAAIDFLTDDQMTTEWRNTARLLRRYLPHKVDPEITAAIVAILEFGPKLLGQLNSELRAQYPQFLIGLYALIAQGTLCVDWDQPLNFQAYASLPNQPYRKMTYERLLHTGRFPDLLREMAMGRRPANQQRLAFARSGRRPISPPSAWGFVSGFAPWQLARLSKANARLARITLDGGTHSADPSLGYSDQIGEG